MESYMIAPVSKAKKFLPLIIATSVIGGLAVIVGICLLATYFQTLGKVSNNEFCMSDSSCLPNSSLVCVSGKCTCPNGTQWNLYSCENTTNVTNTTSPILPISKVISIFNGNGYTMTSIQTFNGTNFAFPIDIVVVNATPFYYVVADYNNQALVTLDLNGNFVEVVYVDNHYLDYCNGYFYVTGLNGVGFVYKLDINFQFVSSFNTAAATTFFGSACVGDYVYVSDGTGNLIRAFDKDFNYNSSQSISGNIYAMTSYQGYLYACNSAAQLLVYKGTTLLNTYSSICKSGAAYDMFAHADSGYIVLSCQLDKKVYLWYTNGSMAFSTGLYINTLGAPRGVLIDPYGRVVVNDNSPTRIEIYSAK